MHSKAPIETFPLVSVIVPSFNQGRFIRETIDSILKQDYRPIEIIVVDGASTDQTLEILHQYDNVSEVKWRSEPDRGVVEAVNKGFALAQGEIGAIQSSDDYYLPNAIRTAVEALQRDPNLGFVFGDVIKIDAQGQELSRTSLRPFSLEGLFSLETWIPQPSTFFRLPLAKKLGGWRETVPYAADTDLWYRMALQTKVRKIDAVFAVRRIHEAQRDKQGSLIASDYSKMIDSLDELRHAPARLRRAAAAGKLLMMNRYGNDNSYWVSFIRQWRAGVIYPPIFRHVSVFSLVPGGYQIRGLLAGMKKMVWGGISYKP
jgi:glycosyltransferase involved in cell wall biosynthesis